MKVEATEGKIIRIVEIKETKRKNRRWFYIIETNENAQYEIIDYTSTKFYEIGDIVLADNYHFTQKQFQQATIVKVVKNES